MLLQSDGWFAGLQSCTEHMAICCGERLKSSPVAMATWDSRVSVAEKAQQLFVRLRRKGGI
jgi:hypothetical protein